ncbi:MAG TPA: IPT/TIG domain-containing protein, partial [Thermoanaerobaculia bacterium]|nr:IPT/TIG domain-containing protein [Thermoanaerobaculia bacterium]
MSVFHRLGFAAALVLFTLAPRLAAQEQPLTIAWENPRERDSAFPAFATIRIGSSVPTPLTIDVATRDLDAKAGTDYVASKSKVTFAAGEREKRVGFTILGDMRHEKDEYFELVVSSPELGTFTPWLIIVDDDPFPNVVIDDVAIEESDANRTATLTVRASEPIIGRVAYRTAGGSAAAGDDFVTTDGELVFNYEMLKTITVTIKGDDDTELDEQFAIRLTSNGSPSFEIGRGIGNVTIADDDPGIGPAELRVPAGGARRAFVRIESPASGTTRVELRASATDAVTVPASVSIPAGSATAAFDIHALVPGRTETVTATFPGGSSAKMQALTYGSAQLVVTPNVLQLTPGQTVTVRATLRPAATVPVTIGVDDNDTVQAAQTFVIPPNGEGTLEIRAVKTGAITITLVLPEAFGGETAAISGSVSQSPPKLAIHGITPPSGPTSGGTKITLTGAGFREGCVLLLGGASATWVTLVDAQTLTAITPSHAAGPVNAVLRCGAESTFQTAPAFTYIETIPVAQAIAPASGTSAGGTHVRVTGSTFDASCWIYFGERAATRVAVHDANTITAITPAQASGAVDVRVVCDATNGTLARAFTFDDAADPLPQIASVSPEIAAPGDVVTIRGSYFRPSDSVAFDGMPAQILESLPDSRAVVVPDAPRGTVSIATIRGGSSTTTGPIFTIDRASPPRVSYVSSTSVAAGAELELRGTAFRNGYSFALGNALLETIALTPTVAVVRVPH